MKKPLRFFAFVFFLFAVYLNLFYKEDSFLARITSGKTPEKKEQAATQDPSSSKPAEKAELAETKEK
jgi:hypothetical protein